MKEFYTQLFDPTTGPPTWEKIKAMPNVKVHPDVCGGKCRDCRKIITTFAAAIAKAEDEEVFRMTS